MSEQPNVLPADAVWLTIGRDGGWHYTLFDIYGARYEFFLWQENGGVHVAVVAPRLERRRYAAASRVAGDGRLRPLGTHAFVTAEAAFGFSAVWTVHWAVRCRQDGAPSILSPDSGDAVHL